MARNETESKEAAEKRLKAEVGNVEIMKKYMGCYWYLDGFTKTSSLFSLTIFLSVNLML